MSEPILGGLEPADPPGVTVDPFDDDDYDEDEED